MTNILAVAAPAHGSGAYGRDEIEGILLTGVSGFRAAVGESKTNIGAEGTHVRANIHTGWWGCGAYGGDKVLMAVLQLLAAEYVGVDELVFYSVDAQVMRQYKALPANAATSTIIDRIARSGYECGVSNGT
jgi:hypothetical protein